jgi:hypothetical protein
VGAEDGGQAAQGVELLALVGVGVALLDPEEVELAMQALGRAPGATDDAL